MSLAIHFSTIHPKLHYSFQTQSEAQPFHRPTAATQLKYIFPDDKTYLDLVVAAETIELIEQFKHRPLHLPVSRLLPSESLGSNRIQLVDEDNRTALQQGQTDERHKGSYGSCDQYSPHSTKTTGGNVERTNKEYDQTLARLMKLSGFGFRCCGRLVHALSLRRGAQCDLGKPTVSCRRLA